MHKVYKAIKEYMVIYLIGAIGYPIIEMIVRGYTHWTMSIAGGVCFVLVYIINIRYNHASLYFRCLLSALSITAVELIVGIIVNYFLKWQIWDYSSLPFNVLGQICPLFTFYWLLLSLPLIVFCIYLKNRLS
jgi:uncharacterized membrane protein